RRPRASRHRLPHPEQRRLSHPEAAGERAARPCRPDRPLRRHGSRRSADRLHRAGALHGRAGRARRDPGRSPQEPRGRTFRRGPDPDRRHTRPVLHPGLSIMAASSQTPRKHLAVDIGGTFTDLVVEAGAQRWTRKVLTTPQAPEQAVIAGTLELLAEIGVAPSEIDLFLHGTTPATNAIIERKGAATALIATAGFRDILDIADEGRYDQYDIFIDKPVPLVPRFRRFTVPERIDAAGSVLLPLDEAALRAVLPEID